VNRIRILLAEDHETVRHGLRLLIDAQPDMEVVAEAGDGVAAVASAEALRPDVAVLDVSMPQMNGLTAAREIAARAPATAIVALTRYDDPAYVDELLRAGALGYVLKQSAAAELLEAIRSAARGERHLDARLTQARPAGPAPARISGREAEVLRLVSRGFSNKEVAAQLGVSVKTVEVHKTNSMRKLGLGGRTELVQYALRQGWLGEE
jgi:DNA-binding NarL/FixJ family response regulator